MAATHITARSGRLSTAAAANSGFALGVGRGGSLAHSREGERQGVAERDDTTVNHRPKEDVMESTQLVDCAGRRRSPATLPGYHRGRPPRNKGLRFPADPPTVEEIISVMRAVIVVLWRAGLRIGEALALNESDLDSERGAVLVRHGKGDKRREVGMDRWAWEQLHPWLELRATLPVGSLFCVLRRPTRGRPCSAAGIRVQLHRRGAEATRTARGTCTGSTRISSAVIRSVVCALG